MYHVLKNTFRTKVINIIFSMHQTNTDEPMTVAQNGEINTPEKGSRNCMFLYAA